MSEAVKVVKALSIASGSILTMTGAAGSADSGHCERRTKQYGDSDVSTSAPWVGILGLQDERYVRLGECFKTRGGFDAAL